MFTREALKEFCRHVLEEHVPEMAVDIAESFFTEYVTEAVVEGVVEDLFAGLAIVLNQWGYEEKRRKSVEATKPVAKRKHYSWLKANLDSIGVED